MNTNKFNTNINKYNDIEPGAVGENSIKKKTYIIESALKNILTNNYDTNIDNIFNLYNCKIHKLNIEINENIKYIKIEKKNLSTMQLCTQPPPTYICTKKRLLGPISFYGL